MDDLRKAQISAQIIAAIGRGMSLRDAFDHVLGKGRFEQVAGEIYDALRAKAQVQK